MRQLFRNKRQFGKLLFLRLALMFIYFLVDFSVLSVSFKIAVSFIIESQRDFVIFFSNKCKGDSAVSP